VENKKKQSLNLKIGCVFKEVTFICSFKNDILTSYKYGTDEREKEKKYSLGYLLYTFFKRSSTTILLLFIFLSAVGLIYSLSLSLNCRYQYSHFDDIDNNCIKKFSIYLSRKSLPSNF